MNRVEDIFTVPPSGEGEPISRTILHDTRYFHSSPMTLDEIRCLIEGGQKIYTLSLAPKPYSPLKFIDPYSSLNSIPFFFNDYT